MIVFKYPVPLLDEFTIALPDGAAVLAVQTQAGEPMLWALVDDEHAQAKPRSFILRGTGHEIPRRALRYIGTFQLHGGSFIGHVFEVLA